MVSLSRILKDFREAGTVSGLIAVWGFIHDAVFLTKAGAVGIACRLSPPDSECLDAETRLANTARVAQVIRQLDEEFRLYIYLLKRPVTPPPPESHPNPAVRAALEERAAYLANAGFFTCEHYMVLLDERFARGPLLTRPWHAFSTPTRQSEIGAQIDHVVERLIEQATTCAALLSDVLAPVRSRKKRRSASSAASATTPTGRWTQRP